MKGGGRGERGGVDKGFLGGNCALEGIESFFAKLLMN